MVAPSRLFFLAKASKSRGVSEVMAPDAETQVRQSLPQACAGPSVQRSNCIGSERASGAATGCGAGGKQQASGSRACGGNESNHP